MKRVLFIGPSLHGSAAALPPEIALRPPAAKGDILAAALDGADIIGLVDGTFDHGAAVWHKEILFALDRGVAVLGAASMGALRAAECAAFGMIGIGAIYDDYVAGRRVSDADVALVHGPAELGFPPLTDALVDIEATLDRLLADGHIGHGDRTRLGATAGALHFKERRWDRLCAPEELARLRPHFVNRKQQDALLLVKAMMRPLDAPRRPIPGGLCDTQFFDMLRREVRNRAPTAP
ncbi:TfuA-like protein [Dongia sp.]|uniref:TfuA-like protein n=1 Tax=Dongia sp. TaxID=1977262 RepID=UPI0035B33EBA